MKLSIRRLMNVAGKQRPPSSLLSGLVSYWKLDESSGGSEPVTRNDSVGVQHLTDINTTASCTGIISNGSSFLRTDANYLQRASEASLQVGDYDFTFALWIYMTSSFDGNFFSKGATEYEFIMSTSGSAYFRTAGLLLLSDSGQFSFDAWNFVLGQHDSVNNLIGIQINNNPLKTVTTDGVAPTTGSGTLIVGCPYASAGAEVYLDEIGRWNRLLSTNEKTSLCNSGGGKTYPFLVGGEIPLELGVSPHPEPTTIYVA